MKLLNKLIFFLFFLVINSKIIYCGENYAILIAAGNSHTSIQGGLTTHDNAEFAYWTGLCLMYETLVLDCGYKPENIFVFYGDIEKNTNNNFEELPNGHRYKLSTDTVHNWGNIVDYPIVNTAFSNSLTIKDTIDNYIAPLITDNDNLLIWWRGHGHAGENKDDYRAKIELFENGQTPAYLNTELSESEIYDLFSSITQYRRRKILWNTCESGCLVSPGLDAPKTFINNGTLTEDNRTIILGAADYGELGNIISYRDEYYSSFTLGIYCAFHCHDPFYYTKTVPFNDFEYSFSEERDGDKYDINGDSVMSLYEIYQAIWEEHTEDPPPPEFDAYYVLKSWDNNTNPGFHHFPQINNQIDSNLQCPMAKNVYLDEQLELKGCTLSLKQGYDDGKRIYNSNEIFAQDVDIPNNSVIEFLYNEKVELKPPFHAQYGSNFHVYNDYLCGEPPSGRMFSKNDTDAYHKLNKNEKSNIIEIIPNPVKELMNVSYYVDKDCYLSIQIVDIYGSIVGDIVKNKWIKSGRYDNSFNCEPIQSGVYFCKIETEFGIIFNKFVVSK